MSLCHCHCCWSWSSWSWSRSGSGLACGVVSCDVGCGAGVVVCARSVVCLVVVGGLVCCVLPSRIHSFLFVESESENQCFSPSLTCWCWKKRKQGALDLGGSMNECMRVESGFETRNESRQTGKVSQGRVKLLRVKVSIITKHCKATFSPTLHFAGCSFSLATFFLLCLAFIGLHTRNRLLGL